MVWNVSQDQACVSILGKVHDIFIWKVWDFWPGNTIPHLPFKMQTFSEKISWTFPPFLLNDMNKVLVFIYIWVYILLNKCFISKMFKLYFWLNISQTSQHFSPSVNLPTSNCLLNINVNWAVSTHTYQYDWTSHWTDLAGNLGKWETRNSDVRLQAGLDYSDNIYMKKILVQLQTLGCFWNIMQNNLVYGMIIFCRSLVSLIIKHNNIAVLSPAHRTAVYHCLSLAL